MEAPQSASPETSPNGPTPTPQRWLEACRAAVERQRELFAAMPTTADRTRYVGVGEGGDNTLEIDKLCEDAVFAELEAIHAEGFDLTVVSEERGDVTFGSGGGPKVVVDPIDGSLNARRTLPQFSVSIAVASGPAMADVEFGYVFDFGTSEEYVAQRGGGATLNGRPLDPGDEGLGLEVVGLEAAKPALAIPVIETLQDEAYRLRVVGSIAISLCLVAASRLDGMLSCRPCRSVDAAAAQLIAIEAGARVSFGPKPPDQVGLGLDGRYLIAAARTDAGMEVLRRSLEVVERA